MIDPLLKAVLENPKEDTPRLMWADELDSRGDNTRAEYIRVSCELARLPKRYKISKTTFLETYGPGYYTDSFGYHDEAHVSDGENGLISVGNRIDYADPDFFENRKKLSHKPKYGLLLNRIIPDPDDSSMCIGVLKEDELSVKDDNYWKLIKRQDQLLGKNWEKWYPWESNIIYGTRNIGDSSKLNCAVYFTFDRGFISKVELPVRCYTEEYARKLFSEHPVESIVLNDRVPYDGENIDIINRWWWSCDDRDNFAHHISQDIFSFIIPTSKIAYVYSPSMAVYSCPIEAQKHLDTACCQYGRSLVGITVND